MNDMIYKLRLGAIHSTEFSAEFNKLGIPFENTPGDEQIAFFRKILDCVRKTASAEMRAAYKGGFKDCVSMYRKTGLI